MGAHSIGLLSHHDWTRTIIPKFKTGSACYTYDFAIELAAKKHFIPIHALDEGIASHDEAHQQIARTAERIGKETYVQRMIEKSAKEGTDPGRMFILRTWKQGNLKILELGRKNNNAERLAREAHWLKTLIPTLATTRRPIAIAVGSNHVVGDGLSDKLQKAGLKVHLIAPKKK